MSTKTEQEDNSHKTYGYLLKRFKTYSETSKWFLGGTAGVLLYGFDKIDGGCLQIAAFLIAVCGVVCFTLAHLADKHDADKWEDKIEADELLNAPFRDDSGNLKCVPLRTTPHAPDDWGKSDGRILYAWGLIFFCCIGSVHFYCGTCLRAL